MNDPDIDFLERCADNLVTMNDDPDIVRRDAAIRGEVFTNRFSLSGGQFSIGAPSFNLNMCEHRIRKNVQPIQFL